jgi:hypothetical protein
MTDTPPLITARIRNAKSLLKQGRDADAIKVLRMALALAPEVPEIRSLLTEVMNRDHPDPVVVEE